MFQAKRFNHRAECAWCKDRIWGLGRQGYRCTNCRLLVHKRCYRFVRTSCGEDHTGSAPGTATRLPTTTRAYLGPAASDFPPASIQSATAVSITAPKQGPQPPSGLIPSAKPTPIRGPSFLPPNVCTVECTVFIIVLYSVLF